MRRIWLPGREPGLEKNGLAYCYRQTGVVGRGELLFVGKLAMSFEGEGIPLRLRYTTGFDVDFVKS